MLPSVFHHALSVISAPYTRVAFATLTVTAVHSPNPKRSPGPEPPPHVGETATITLRHDVLTDPLTRINYCGLHAPDVCGCVLPRSGVIANAAQAAVTAFGSVGVGIDPFAEPSTMRRPEARQSGR